MNCSKERERSLSITVEKTSIPFFSPYTRFTFRRCSPDRMCNEGYEFLMYRLKTFYFHSRRIVAILRVCKSRVTVCIEISDQFESSRTRPRQESSYENENMFRDGPRVRIKKKKKKSIGFQPCK